MTERVFLIDASLYIFRAWHAIAPEQFPGQDGWPVNAAYGFTRFLLELLEQTEPSHVAVAFDESLGTSFRNRIYPPYKANRDPAPEALKRQFALCREVAAGLGLHVLESREYEADDLIGTLAVHLRQQGMACTLVSADKDLSQLLGPDDLQWDYARQRQWDAAGVRQRLGVHPHQIPDFLGLAGDAVDNIPGVPGIGVKTAAALLQHFDTLDALLARVDELPFLRLRGAASHARRLREHADKARLSQQLATIALDAPLPADIGVARRQAVHAADLLSALDRIGAGPITRRQALELSDC